MTGFNRRLERRSRLDARRGAATAALPVAARLTQDATRVLRKANGLRRGSAASVDASMRVRISASPSASRACSTHAPNQRSHVGLQARQDGSQRTRR
jgi:hypothetical protein